ncbi:MAG: Kae1-associated kinase Bud32 [Candidatus Methanogaster sp.]|uniref:Kae1-associated kinase Bud32 n=1 Tax=Candidatus Methanogaster sp. TaxID=3386292 RepID=A0AC61L6R1_9EURY|nr:MAG: Kae1-associated kinase Bud32 [ANME-2 cluster archaeon]
MNQQIAAGAEAVIERSGGRIIKRRVSKNYRTPELDTRIRVSRTRSEAKLISEARRCGVPTPIIYDVDTAEHTITMEFIEGPRMKDVLDPNMSERIGELVGRLHGCGIIHGDLTTSNLILHSDDGGDSGGRIYFIDFGLGYFEKNVEAQGVDVHVLFQTFVSTHGDPGLEEAFSRGYRRTFADADQVLTRVREIEARGRYL